MKHRSLRRRLLIALVVAPLHVYAAETDIPAPESFVVSKRDKPCDSENHSWSIQNVHTYRSVRVQVKWHPVGGRERTETVVLEPDGFRAIGCAPLLEILSEELLDF